MAKARMSKLVALEAAECAALKDLVTSETDRPSVRIKAIGKRLGVAPLTLMALALGLPARKATVELVRAGLAR